MGLKIHMSNVPGLPDSRELDEPLFYVDKEGKTQYIPSGFIWDGSSVPFGFNALFPRHRHPIASCRHDWRCSLARNDKDRKFADKEFKKDVDTTSWKLTSFFGYLGVRAGAFLGIGSNY